jgi:motility quorum-sensing regulator/GCU-specific mRNA interferase toxin
MYCLFFGLHIYVTLNNWNFGFGNLLTFLIILVKIQDIKKKKAYYSLSTIQAMIQNDATRFITVSALQGAFKLGFDESDIICAISMLEPKDLYKSMTSHNNSSIWQDVYRKKYQDVNLYIKLQLVGNAVAISFKELSND